MVGRETLGVKRMYGTVESVSMAELKGERESIHSTILRLQLSSLVRLFHFLNQLPPRNATESLPVLELTFNAHTTPKIHSTPSPALLYSSTSFQPPYPSVHLDTSAYSFGQSPPAASVSTCLPSSKAFTLHPQPRGNTGETYLRTGAAPQPLTVQASDLVMALVRSILIISSCMFICIFCCSYCARM